MTNRFKDDIIYIDKTKEDNKMGYFIIDAMGNFICTEACEIIARQMAEELGGDYIPIEG